MASKRPPPKPSAPSSSPVVTAILMGAAVAFGLWSLVRRGRVSWPPHHLLADAYTLAGCLALVGPVVLARREGSGLGDLLWMTGGILVWVFDLAAVVRGDLAALSWTAPLGYQPMGLTILAVLVAGCRGREGGRDWSWTNVTGWVLGLFWVGMALGTLVPGRALRMASGR
jgi:hypothetical protein